MMHKLDFWNVEFSILPLATTDPRVSNVLFESVKCAESILKVYKCGCRMAFILRQIDEIQKGTHCFQDPIRYVLVACNNGQ